MSKVTNKMKKSGAKDPKSLRPKRPLWKGPQIDGVTQSLFSGFLCCRERFRVKVVEGLKTPDDFRHPLEYGNMWHLCEEKFAVNEDWQEALKVFVKELCKKYPLRQEQVVKWYRICQMQFPIYIEYWKNNSDVKNRTPLMQEVSFRVPYELASGFVVLLRGKWDSVDLIKEPKCKPDIFLQENKTKGTVDEEAIATQLNFDLQTMFYLVALRHCKEKCLEDYNLKGVRYNVIRRPLGQGKGCIRQHKPSAKNPSGESSEEYYARLEGVIEELKDTFFLRYKVEITKKELDIFETTFLQPCLQNLCEWWEWIIADVNHPWRKCPETGVPGGAYHWRHPYGIFNPMDKGNRTDLDEYIETKSMTGLTYATTLFPELDD